MNEILQRALLKFGLHGTDYTYSGGLSASGGAVYIVEKRGINRILYIYTEGTNLLGEPLVLQANTYNFVGGFPRNLLEALQP